MRSIVFAFAAVLLMVAPATAADDCTLNKVADLDISIGTDGLPTVPVSISGKTYRFFLSFAGTSSAVSAQVAQAIGATTEVMKNTGYTQKLVAADLPDVVIGHVHADMLPLMISPNPLPGGADGRLGLSVLSNYDLELDFSASKLRLFRQDQCPGVLLYWGKPFALVRLLNADSIEPGYKSLVPHIDVMLDGKTFHAVVNPAVRTTLIGTLDMRDAFGIKMDDPSVTAAPDDLGQKRFRYPFKTLFIGGMTIADPDIELYDQNRFQQCNGKYLLTPDHYTACFTAGNLSIGRKELNALRLFFAFKEQKLYVTASDTTPAVANPEPQK